VVNNGKKLEKKVYPVPEEIDREIARLKLKSMSVRIDKLTPKQEKYLASWEEGRIETHARLASRLLRHRAGLAEFLPISSSGHLALVLHGSLVRRVERHVDASPGRPAGTAIGPSQMPARGMGKNSARPCTMP